MAMSILPIVIVAVVLIAVVAAIGFGGRGSGWMIAAVLALGVLGAAGFLFLGRTVVVAPPPPPTVPVNETVTMPEPAPPPPPVTPDGPTMRLAGRVLLGLEGETPAEGAAVVLIDRSGGHAPTARPLATVTTGADGTFVFEAAPGSVNRVMAVLPGWGTCTLNLDFGGGTDNDALVLRLLPAAELAGAVTEATSGEAVGGATIVWRDAVSARTGEDGAFSLPSAAIGDGVLSVHAPGYAAHTENLALTPAGRVDLAITLQPEVRVTGLVIDTAGRPVAEAEVLVAEKIQMGPVAMDRELPLARSGADGTWTLAGRKPGDSFTLRARTDDGRSASVAVGPLVRGEPVADVTLVIEPAPVLTVTVVDEAGAPVEGASVSVRDETNESQVRMGMFNMNVATAGGVLTDGDGVAQLRDLDEGPVTVVAAKEDFVEGTVDAAASKEVPTTARIVLAEGLVIAGTVVDDAGEPVPGAAVSARRFAMNGMVMQNRTTGDDGTFRVGGLSAGGAFNLTVSAEGFVRTSVNGIAVGNEDVVVEVRRGGRIEGVAIDTDGEPVTNFSVKATERGAEGGMNFMDWEGTAGRLTGTAFEDPGGMFLLDGLAPGEYDLEVTAPDLAPGRVEALRVAAGETTDVEVTLPVGLRLRGIVVRTDDGSPVPGARVAITGEGMFGEMDFDMDMGADAEEALAGNNPMAAMFGGGAGQTTDAAGRFELKGLEEGTLNLRVKAAGMAPAVHKGVEVPGTGELRVEMQPEASIFGVVYDAEEQPLSGAMVMVQKIPTFMRMATTDDQGRYEVKGLAAGSYMYMIMENPAAGMGGGMNMKTEGVRLEAGQRLEKDYHLGGGTKVRGRVTRGGEPVGGVMVLLTPASASNPMAAMMGGGGGGNLAMGTTEDDGSYEIAGVSPGRYTVMVQSQMMGGAPSGTGDAVTVAKGTPLVTRDIELPLAGIRGIVVDDTGSPVVGAMVAAVRPGSSTTRIGSLDEAFQNMGGQTMTDDAGRFSLDDMNPGTWDLRVQAGGFNTVVQEGVVAAQGSGEVRVTLERGTEVRVRVLDHTGAPVAGAGIFLTDSEGRELSTLEMFDAPRTNAEGEAVVIAPAGEIRFECQARGHAPGEVVASVPGGTVTIRLPKPCTLRILVLGTDGQPMPDAVLDLRDGDGEPWRQRFSLENLSDLLTGMRSDSAGVLVRSDLPAGSYIVRMSAGDLAGEASVSLGAGETSEVRVRLR